MQLPIAQLAAFADGPFSGNPAAVCLLKHWLSDGLLQAIAAEINQSETAFVLEGADRNALRWFTPRCEVDLCGHATLAAAQVMFTRDPGRSVVQFDSRSGVLTVHRHDPHLILDFPAKPAKPCDTPAALVNALGATPLSCHRSVDWMAVFASESEIRALQPNLERLSQLEGRGVIVTAPGDQADVVSRFFAPKIGIAEDPVTGSAHCTLTPYWAEQLGQAQLEARQLSARGGTLHCCINGDRVLIGGRVIPFLSGMVEVLETNNGP
ncbi:MAG: PhzF family phenazine biosynthesis protein [Synechococcus sp.]|nr:PhzF family phenazine biosynthesis protein [Synechococcus sp.]